MAVLVATGCRAVSNAGEQAIQWESAGGRAVYTNTSADTQLIQPLGVSLQAGHTLAIHWAYGDSAYAMKIRPSHICKT
jgi:hypothetical protein